MKELNFEVKKMVCAGCENAIKNALQNMEGVEKVEANHSTGEVKILLKNEIPAKQIEQRINDLGYEVVKEK